MERFSPTDRPVGRARPTLRDVASLAGVSIKTASRVVNGEAGVSAGKTSSVLRAVTQLDYRPNLAASSLRRAGGREAAIGAVLEDLANPFSSVMLRALEDAAWERDVLIFAGSVDEDPTRERALVRAFSMRRASAFVIAPTGADQGYLAHEVEADAPVVFVDRPPVGVTGDAVRTDHEAGAASAVHHLVAHGHRDIAYLGDLRSIATARHRLHGFRDALGEHGIALPPRRVVQDLHTDVAAESAVHRLMTGAHPPTALFTAQNLVTIGAVRALQRLGLGSTTALVGFDDFPVAELLQPAVTVVSQDVPAIGRLAAQMVFRRLDGETDAPRTELVPARLVARGSGEVTPPG